MEPPEPLKPPHPDSRAKAHHLLLASEDEANALKARIHNLHDLMQLAPSHSRCPSAKIGGDLGLCKPGVMVGEMETVVFNAPLDTLIGPIQTVHGFHLVWIKKRHFADA